MIFHQGKRPWILGSRIPNQMADGIAKLTSTKGWNIWRVGDISSILTLIHSKVGYVYLLKSVTFTQIHDMFFAHILLGGVGNKLTLSTHSELYGLVWWISRRRKSKISPQKNGDPFLLEQRVFLFTQHEGSSNLDVPYHVTKIFGSWEFL